MVDTIVENGMVTDEEMKRGDSRPKGVSNEEKKFFEGFHNTWLEKELVEPNS